ncbi:MAG: hypothetical protein PVJ33_10455 [Lysobacterales bacterium]
MKLSPGMGRGKAASLAPTGRALKPTFDFIERSALRVIACIEDPPPTREILEHVQRR